MTAHISRRIKLSYTLTEEYIKLMPKQLFQNNNISSLDPTMIKHP